MSFTEIEKLATEFLKEACVIKRLEEKPAGFCFETVFPLQIFLLLNDINCQIRAGRPEGKRFDGTIGVLDHFWIQIVGGDGIVDPTIKQFNEYEPTVYVGNKSDSLTTSKYPASIYPSYFWFNEVYLDWARPCHDLSRWNPQNDTEIGINWTIISFIHRLSLASALFVHLKEHMFQGKITTGDRYKDFYINRFFDPIINFISNCERREIQFDFKQLPENFQELLDYVKTVNR